MYGKIGVTVCSRIRIRGLGDYIPVQGDGLLYLYINSESDGDDQVAKSQPL